MLLMAEQKSCHTGHHVAVSYQMADKPAISAKIGHGREAKTPPSISAMADI
jgi:hypothetical protein